MEPPNRIAVVHRIERRHLIDPHRRHLQYPSHLVHHTNAREAVLALAEIEQGHNGGFLVLGRVARENFFDELLILSIEFEGNAGVILGAVAVLKGVSTAEKVWMCDARTYYIEGAGLAARGDGDLEGAALLAEGRSSCSDGASYRPRGDFGSHWVEE